MPQIIACPFCQQQFTIGEDQYAGYKDSEVTCSACQKTFSIVEEAGALKAIDPGARIQYAAAPASRTNGFAIAGLIAGISGLFTCGLGAIIGLVLSYIGLKKSKELGSGRGLAIAGIIVSILMLLLNLMMIAILIPSLSRARASAIQVSCAANLRQIGQAAMLYANDNKGFLPPDLAAVSQTLGGSTQVCVCPGDRAPALTSGSITTSYVYLPRLGDKASQSQSARRIMAYESPKNHDGRAANFLFLDGHVESLDANVANSVIQQLEQGINPPKTKGDSATLED